MIRGRWWMLVIGVLLPVVALAQEHRFDAGGQVAIVQSGEFDEQDIGFGVRVAWRPAGLLGVEGEVNFFPSEFQPSSVAISGSRTEGLFGATIGPRLGIVRPFARVRPGFLRYSEAPGPVPCILIFPPPLSCQIAAGKTMFVFDVGGGVEIDAGRRTFFRLDVGDRIVRYPEPSDAGHDIRVGVGWAFRF